MNRGCSPEAELCESESENSYGTKKISMVWKVVCGTVAAGLDELTERDYANSR